MTSARRRGAVPPIDPGEVRFRVWVAVISGLLAAVLMAYFGHRVYVETAANSAHRASMLVLEPGKVLEVNYSSAVGGYGGNAGSQEVRYRLSGGSEVVSFVERRDAYLNVNEGEYAMLGLWHGHLVTVEGQYVRDPWTPGAALVFPLLPAAFVLMVLQVYRVWRLRRAPPKYLFRDNSSLSYTRSAALLALGAGFVAMFIDGIPWVPVLAFVASALGPLAWFAIRELGERRTTTLR
ncbi:hypothetical protein [Micromonospora sp. NPDC092111]|uniref:hypothetical protein n=1 Tax=Micromonospora sp. NPDC092111 TaxID=3364289 RepID=UPI003820BAF1